MMGVGIGWVVLLMGGGAQDPDIDSLIGKLRSDQVEERDAASARLEKFGPEALEPLREALKKSDDPEVQARLSRAIGEIEFVHLGPRRMVFTRGKGMDAELYLWEKGEATKLTDNKSLEARPVLSPDGKRVVYFKMSSYDEWKDAETFVMDLTDRKPVKVGSGVTPVWSPDGTRIAYVREGEIHVVGADGKDDKIVLGTKKERWSPVWSHDGKQIAYEEDDGISVVDVADGKSRSVFSRIKGAPTLSTWSWSPDGKSFAMVAGSGPYHWDLYTVEADGSNLTKRTEASWTGHGTAQWGPDSRHVAVCVRLGSGRGPVAARPGMLDTGLHVLDVKSGTFNKVADDVSPMLPPCWSPDGTFIVYVNKSEEIWIGRAAGGAPRKLTEMSVPNGAYSTWFPPDAQWGD